MAAIRLDGVAKVFPNGHTAVHDLTLEIADGELLVLVGPSGCGKSTVLRLIAGLETPTRGRLVIGDDDVTRLPPQQRDLAMVFQNYALYPHLTVRENLSFGLEVRGTDAARIAERVARTASSLDLDELLDRRPSQLSGGQRQRVALGRALVREPRAFLLDEPLSNLDPLLRVATRAELALLHRRLGATMVYVTHDQEEAMTLGTRIAVMHRGRLEQVAPPLEVFDRPATTFVARFVGSPAMNLWPARLAEGGRQLTTSAFAVEAPSAAEAAMPSSDEVTIGVRPHDLQITAPGAGDLDVAVEVVEPLGQQAIVHGRAAGGATDLVRVLTAVDGAPAPGASIGLRLRRDRLHLFDTRTGHRL